MNGKIKVKSQFLEEKETYEKSEEKSYMENIMLKKNVKNCYRGRQTLFKAKNTSANIIK